MVLNATLVVVLGLVVRRTWVMSRFMEGGAKAGQIFLLIMVTGLCLITNVVAPFVVTGLLVAALEVRSLVFAPALAPLGIRRARPAVPRD
jgi:hypothetical protein